MNNGIRRIEFVDFAKGFAILTIILFHYSQPLQYGQLFSQAIVFGGTGIHLFFMLSGFGLNMKPPGNALKFYRRRFSRILIPYFIFVTLAFAVSEFTPIYREFGWREWLSHILLYKMFFEDYIGSFGYHLWFISTLIQFYLLFPLLYKLKEKAGNVNFLILCCGISLIYILYLGISGKGDLRTWNSFFPRYLWEFGLGMFLASMKNNQAWFTKKTIWYLIAAISGLIIMAAMSLKMGQFGRVLNDFPAFAAYLSLTIFIYRAGLLPVLSFVNKGVLFVSQWSYELYLVHFIVFTTFLYLMTAGGMIYNLLWILPVLLLSLFTAYLFHRFIKILN
jgi:peptidoglycan/LPS O-acetylase OafA/YrhL